METLNWVEPRQSAGIAGTTGAVETLTTLQGWPVAMLYPVVDKQPAGKFDEPMFMDKVAQFPEAEQTFIKEVPLESAKSASTLPFKLDCTRLPPLERML